MPIPLATPPGYPSGDYNANGTVDAADYVLWRKNPGAFPVNAYDTWRANFGATGGATNSIGFRKVGSNTLVLTGNNTYTGGTDFNRGVLSLGSAGAINSTGTLTFSGGTLQHTAVNTTDYSSRISTAANQAVSIDTNGENVTYASNLISAGGSLAKLGSGTLTLSGANTYSGTTSITAGTLKITGSHTGGDVYTIAPNSGDVADVLVEPGASISTASYMTVGLGGTGTVTQNGGSVDAGYWITLGEQTTATGYYNLVSGSVSTGNLGYQNLVLGFQGAGSFHQTAGDVYVNGALVVGWTGTATGNYLMDSGTVSVTGPIQLGLDGGAVGTFTMNDGSITCNDWVVTGTFGGTGHFYQYGGTIDTVIFDVAQNGGSSGDYHMDGAGSTITTAPGGFFAVGDYGLGTFDFLNGTINVGSGINGSLYVGSGDGGNGTMTQSAGSITVGDWSHIGNAGIGIYNMNGGSFSTGDNLVVGNTATGNGNLHVTAGTVTLVGNDPPYTGNILVGNDGIGAITIEGGAIELISTTTTTNSAYEALALMDESKAYDGNFFVGNESNGIGAVTQTDGDVNVNGNIFLGRAGVGTWTQSGGTTTVGLKSGGTGGDLIIGKLAGAFSPSVYQLQGGTLDVSRGSGMIALGAGSGSFEFTGGTLKVKSYNSSAFGGNLGDLVQNGSGSMFDVTGNDTTIEIGSYDLGAGSATIGSGHMLTIQLNVLNSSGVGEINVGQGGAAATLTVGGAVAVDTLNLNVGIVTTTSGVSVATALKGNGTITGNVTVGSGAQVAPGLSAGELDITGDFTLDSSSTVKIELGGLTAGTFDVIDLTGALAAAGSLEVSLINSFTPSPGNSWHIFDFGSQSGSFTLATPGGTWSYTAATGNLNYLSAGLGAGGAVPEPALGGLLAVALAGMCGANRRRSS